MACKKAWGWRLRVTSVRGLMLAIAVLSAWMAWQTNRARAQRRAIDIIEASGGGFRYEDQPAPCAFCCLGQNEERPPGPAWLRNRLGDDYFRRVSWVGFDRDWEDFDRYRPLADDAILSLRALGDLTQLDLGGRTLTDRQLGFVAAIPSLEYLRLSDCRGITSRGMEQLKGLPNSCYVDYSYFGCEGDGPNSPDRKDGSEQGSIFGSSSSNGQGLGRLRSVPQLRRLTFYEAEFDDAEMSELGRLSQVQCLSLSKCPQITDRGFRELSRLTDLSVLELDDLPGLTDEGLSALAHLKSLTRLSLRALRTRGATFRLLTDLPKLEDISISDTPISDEALLDLAEIKGLKRVYCSQTAITPDGIAAFKALRPDLAYCEFR